MSGFEIAGIVLGAFPLAIEGLKMYEKLARQWDMWRQTGREYTKCLHELNYHRLSFESHLRRLLLPLVVVESQMIETLIASPKGQEWRDAALNDALRQRLDKSYDTYLGIMHSLQSLMVDAENHLGINSLDLQARLLATELPSTHRSVLSIESIKYQQYRIKFIIGESARKNFFSQLQMYNERLEKLLTSSDQLQELEKDIPQVFSRDTLLLADPGICLFWQHAQKVHNAFSEAWTCTCRSQHHIQLLLQNRKGKEDREMRLILTSKSPVITDQRPGHSVILRGPTDLGNPHRAPEEEIGLASRPKQPQHRSLRTLRSSLSGNKSHEESRKGKRRSGPSILAFELQTVPSSTMRDIATDCQRITNICHKLAEGFGSGTISGYLEGDTCKYYMSSEPGSTSRLLPQQKSLEDMLLNAEKKPTRRQRYAISLILASSFLQLQNTQWITCLWQKSSIVFPEQKVGTDGVRIDAPFVAHNLRDGDTGDVESNLPAQGLSSLGVTLLELCFGNVIEDHPRRPKLPPELDTAEVKTALDAQAAACWLKDVTEEAGPDFTNAIGWCLSKHLTLHDKSGWRQEMLKQVVWPLCKISSTFS
ncbi:hypothetical protein BJ166DRAFT_378472 [Pestalotiopsis sp. NC0098]|nr:hypothetical protein BJ166DRAFT_378472 [Pestalotiopsis sp. NC0098]